MSSSAFFIEAAANTMMVFSCAVADTVAPARTTRAAKTPAMRFMGGAPSLDSRAHFRLRTQIRRRLKVKLRQTEAPFRQSLIDAQSGGMSRSQGL